MPFAALWTAATGAASNWRAKTKNIKKYRDISMEMTESPGWDRSGIGRFRNAPLEM